MGLTFFLALFFTVGLAMWAFGSDGTLQRIGQVLAVLSAAIFTLSLAVGFG